MPKSDTWFQKGQSGNPGGRPKNRAAAGNLARSLSDQVIYSLLSQTTDRRIAAKERRAAAKILLRIGFGKAGDIGAEVLRAIGWQGTIEALREAEESETQAERRREATAAQRQAELKELMKKPRSIYAFSQR